MIALSDYLILSSIVFCIGLAGIFINRTNIIMILMCVELILAAVNTNFIAFSFYGSDLSGTNICILYFDSGCSRGCYWPCDFDIDVQKSWLDRY